MSGEEYDEWRLADRRGALLTEHDMRFFRDMSPEVQPQELGFLGRQIAGHLDGREVG
jgi:hypothetical protein